jgi:hypothetical protein
MSAAHRAGALAKMKEHHAEAVRLRASDPAASRAAAKRATHAADVVKSIDSGAPVGTVDPSKDFSPGYFRSSDSTGTTTTTTTTGIPVPGSTPFVRTRMGYDPSTMVDYTSTNPAYWASAVSYFQNNPNGNRSTGELGIWIPNFEKEGAERTALAAIAGGVTAHVDSNYANRTVTDAGRKTATESYRGGPAEKAIRLAGTHRGGTEVTGAGIGPMGSTASSEHGVYIKGGKVVKGAGVDYVKGGGDFGGLLSEGDTITGDWLTGILGAMDGDGMRIGGTYPSVRGATGSGVGAGGLATGVGSTYAGGVDPVASMPDVADYTAYMDPNSIFGGLSDNAAVNKGLLYQTMADNYGSEMEAAGMPAPGAGLLSGYGGAGPLGGSISPTYGSAPSGFKAAVSSPAAGAVGGGTTTIHGSPSASYDIPETLWGYKSSLIPRFASYAAMDKYGHSDVMGGVGPFKGYSGKVGGMPMGGFVGGDLYEMGGGDGWSLHKSFPASTT